MTKRRQLDLDALHKAAYATPPDKAGVFMTHGEYVVRKLALMAADHLYYCTQPGWVSSPLLDHEFDAIERTIDIYERTHPKWVVGLPNNFVGCSLCGSTIWRDK